MITVESDFDGVQSSLHRYVVAGDFVHHLYVGDYAKEYPNAKVIGVEGLPEKRTDVKFDGGRYRAILRYR